MSEKATPKGVAEDMRLECIELDDAQPDRISGSQFIPEENRYICDYCGTECDFVDVTHNYLPAFECPNCGRRYVAL